MFGNKISESDYNEVSEKYLMAEAAYNNEKLKSEELQKTVIALQNQINELKQNGIVDPALLENYKKLEEKNNTLIAENKELSEKLSNTGNVSDKTVQLKEQIIVDLQNKLNAEISKTVILEEKLKCGGKKMQDELTQWEYKKIGSNELNDIENLNKLGEQGWEVASSHSNGNYESAILKRPKQKQKQSEYGYSR